jgi:nitrate reductase gamma subunit
LLVVFVAVLGLAASSEGAHAAFVVIAKFYRLTGAAGAAFVLLGAVGLLARRTFDRGVRVYTTRGDIANLLMFAVAIGLAAVGYVTGGAAGVGTLANGLITFDTSVHISPLFALGLLLTSALVAYIPFTHMSHFMGKYFTFHTVRWDDAQNRRDGEMEPRIAGVMAYRPAWSASHIAADGSKSWPELAAANPAQEVRK